MRTSLVVLLLNLDDVNTKVLLVVRVDLTKEAESLPLALCLRHDLLPRLSRQHVGETMVNTDRLDPYHARRVTGLELQQLTGLQPLDAVIADPHLESLLAGHDCVVVWTLDAHLAHRHSFLIETDSPLLNDASRRIPSREHPSRLQP